jgi:cyclohexadieny/prephenate dehydrogenase
MIFHRIAIIGIGHIGASIALAARAANVSEHIGLYDVSPDVRARAKEIGLGEIFNMPEEAVKQAELVIFCVPVGAMKAAAERVARSLKIGAIVSDVGSVKRAVVDAIQSVLPEYIYLVPGHPLAGTEHSGPDAGVASLFQKRWALLTPFNDERPAYQAAVGQLAEFWTGLGANVETMDIDRHDVVLAVTSHLPHLIAFNTVAMAEDLETVTESEVVKFSASGFRDFTRIAASDPTMWRDIFLNNKEAVLEVLGRFSEDLAALQRAIRWGDGQTLFDLFERARRMRREVIEAGQDTNWGRDKTQ